MTARILISAALLLTSVSGQIQLTQPQDVSLSATTEELLSTFKPCIVFIFDWALYKKYDSLTSTNYFIFYSESLSCSVFVETITQYRNEEITRLVYVRFRDADGTVSSLYLDDIILDINAPHGHGSVAAQGTLLELTATDDLSGVAQMRVSAQPDFSDTNWVPFSAQQAWDFGARPTVYLQFRDAADNLSSRYTVSTAGNTTIFLPLVLH